MSSDTGRDRIRSACARPTPLKGRVPPTHEQLTGGSMFHHVNTPPKSWAIFCFDSEVPNRQLIGFVTRMVERSRELGLPLGRPCPVAKANIKDRESLANVFWNLFNKTNAGFVLIGIPNRHRLIPPSTIHSMVKHYCDHKYGIVSQCFQSEYVTSPPAGYFDNFLLKVNGKLGRGLSAILSPVHYSTLPFNSARTMLVGIDVNHSSKMDRVRTSSIAAAVGSLDSTFTRYSASIRVQKKRSREKVITCLGDMIGELLDDYRKTNRFLPENVIIFRDGISSTQFESIRRMEIVKVQAAINRAGKSMKITFIVTQNSHNTQPSKYVILRDDLNLSADTIQRLCFLLGYNNRGAKSLPTPIRYADLCASRSKLYLELQLKQIRNGDLDQLYHETAIIMRLNQMVKLHESIKRSLFYC